MGILTLQKWIPDSDGFGRGSDSGGFRRIPGPQKWNQQTQLAPYRLMYIWKAPEVRDRWGWMSTSGCAREKS